MMKYLYISVMALLLGACMKANSASSEPAPQPREDSSLELPMPAVPDSLTDRGDKLRYVACHFWDALDFGDTSLSADEDFMGQNFANYAFLLAHLPDSVSQTEAASIFIGRAEADPRAMEIAKKTVRQYLTGRDSPVRDEGVWLAFLDAFINYPALSQQDRARYEYEKEAALKNREGTVASDFEFELRLGGKSTLLATPAGSEGMILMFYNPDCDHCEETIEQMRNSAALNEAIAEGRLTVLAVDAEEEYDEWNDTKALLPSNWTVGFNTDGLADRDLYILPSMPTIYLLDADHRVVDKEWRP